MAITFKKETLEDEVSEVLGRHRDDEEPIHVYAHENPEYRRKTLEYAKDYFSQIKEEYAPKTWGERAMASVAPGTYILMKLPLDVHQRVIEILEYITPIAARANLPAGLILGLGRAAARITYGLKTKSFKDVVYGLVGAVTHLKKLPLSPKGDAVAERTIKTLEDVLNKDDGLVGAGV